MPGAQGTAPASSAAQFLNAQSHDNDYEDNCGHYSDANHDLVSKDCNSHSLKFFCSLTFGHVWDHRHGNDLGEEDHVLECDEKGKLGHKHLVVERGPFAVGIVESAVAV